MPDPHLLQGAIPSVEGQRPKFLPAVDRLRLVRPLAGLIIVGNLVYAGLRLQQKFDSASIPAKVFSPSEVHSLFSPNEQRPWEYYEELVGRRDLFNLVSPNSADQVLPEPSTTASIPEQILNLKVVGIIFDRVRQAVLQSADGKETFFVKENEGLNGATIRDIKEDKVILEFQGQTIELAR